MKTCRLASCHLGMALFPRKIDGAYAMSDSRTYYASVVRGLIQRLLEDGP